MSSCCCGSRILFMCEVSLQDFRQQLDKIRPVRRFNCDNTCSGTEIPQTTTCWRLGKYSGIIGLPFSQAGCWAESDPGQELCAWRIPVVSWLTFDILKCSAKSEGQGLFFLSYFLQMFYSFDVNSQKVLYFLKDNPQLCCRCKACLVADRYNTPFYLSSIKFHQV